VWGFCFRLYFRATAHISLIRNFYKQTLATYSCSKTVKNWFQKILAYRSSKVLSYTSISLLPTRL